MALATIPTVHAVTAVTKYSALETDEPLQVSSLQVVEVRAALQRSLHLDIPIEMLLSNGSPNEIARKIIALIGTGVPPAPAVVPSTQSEPLVGQDVSITGMACRLPQDSTRPSALWHILACATCTIRHQPPERWARQCTGLNAALQSAAFLEGIDSFDAAFFEVDAEDAAGYDPHVRIMLTVAAEALAANSGADKQSNASVTISASQQEFESLMPGFNHARLIAQTLKLTGPTEQFDKACTSSHIAMHEALQSLRRRDCDRALLVAASLLLVPTVCVGLLQNGVLSPSGQCLPFDQSADGLVRGEAAVALVLQLADTHSVHYASLVGSAVTQNRNSLQSLLAPDSDAQLEALTTAVADAGIACTQLDLMHVHGVGQKVSDAAELMAYRNAELPVCLPLVNHKGNLGHGVAAAGLTAGITAALAAGSCTGPRHAGLAQPAQLLQGCPGLLVGGAATCLPAPVSQMMAIHGHAISGVNADLVLKSSSDLQLFLACKLLVWQHETQETSTSHLECPIFQSGCVEIQNATTPRQAVALRLCCPVVGALYNSGHLTQCYDEGTGGFALTKDNFLHGVGLLGLPLWMGEAIYGGFEANFQASTAFDHNYPRFPDMMCPFRWNLTHQFRTGIRHTYADGESKEDRFSVIVSRMRESIDGEKILRLNDLVRMTFDGSLCGPGIDRPKKLTDPSSKAHLYVFAGLLLACGEVAQGRTSLQDYYIRASALRCL